MLSLPIYTEMPKAAVEEADPLDICHDCRRCALSGLPDLDQIAKRAKTKKSDLEQIELEVQKALNKQPRVANVCIAPEGEPGGLLVITGHPDLDSDRIGRPMMSKSGRWARKKIAEVWDGPIAADFAVRCAPGSMAVSDAHYAACRGYLHQTIKEVRPKRIIALGNKAVKGILGRSPSTLSARRGYGWIADGMIPVFILIDPRYARQNPFVEGWFESDLRWACDVDIASLRRDFPIDGLVHLIDDIQGAEACERAMQQASFISWDVETAGYMYNKHFKVLCVGMAAQGSEDAWVWTKGSLKNKNTFSVFKRIMEDSLIKKIPQNGKYDRLALKCAYGIDVEGNAGDTLFWRKLLESDADADLATLQELVGMGGGKQEAKEAEHEALKLCRQKSIGKGKAKRDVTDEDLAKIGPLEHVKAIRNGEGATRAHVLALIPDDVLYRYCGRDALSTSKVAELIKPQLDKVPEVAAVWEDLVHPASLAIVQVEHWGVYANQDALSSFQAVLQSKKEALEDKFKEFGEDFNPDSARQVGALLFDRLGLKPPKMTNGGQPSTDAATLKLLKDKHTVVENLLEYRMICKQQSTYAEGMKEHIRGDGRIHPSFRLAGTRTGRLSCSEPNLQNITAPYTWYGKMARDIFAAPPGKVMVQLDFSQLELRVAAMISGDPKMKKIFADGLDYHQATAELIAPVAWGIPASEVTSGHRKQAKVVNFGLLYGMGDGGLASRIGCTKQEAKKIRQGVLGSFAVYDQWAKDQVATAKRTGYTWTWWGGRLARRRSLWRIRDQDQATRITAENGAGNTPVQGTASDFCLASLVACVKWLLESGFPAKLVLTVHDSLIFEVDEDRVVELIEKVQGIMQGWFSEGVPILVDIEVGLSWGSLFKVKKIDGQWFAVWKEKLDNGEEVDMKLPWREKVYGE